MTTNDSKFINEDDKAKIEVDVTDWLKQYQDAETNLADFDAAIAHQQKTGAKPLEMGRLLIIARHASESDVLDTSDKMLFNVGAATKWSGQVARHRKPVTLENGKKVEVREYVGTVKTYDPVNDDKGIVEVSIPSEDLLNGPEMANVLSEEAAHRALLYLQRYVPGYIRDRLEIIAANKGDVREAGEELIKFIEGVMTELE